MGRVSGRHEIGAGPVPNAPGATEAVTLCLPRRVEALQASAVTARKPVLRPRSIQEGTEAPSGDSTRDPAQDQDRGTRLTPPSRDR
jgi:hypothetical protein